MKNILTTLLVALSFQAAAADWALQVNGASWHSEKRPNGESYNSSNIGVGLQHSSVLGAEKDFVLVKSVGTLVNSLEDKSWYAWISFFKRWGSDWHFDAGASAGVITYPSAKSQYLAGVIPTISVGKEQFGVNLVFSPKFEDVPAVVFAQAYFGL